MPLPQKKEKHIHKFLRHRYKSGNVTYFCVNDCPAKIAPPLALGKECICWRCGEPFRMNEYSIRLAKPHCEKCHQPKDDKRIELKMPQLIVTVATEHVTQQKPLSLAERLAATLKQAQEMPKADDVEDI